jgi:hypothetical protein
LQNDWNISKNCIISEISINAAFVGSMIFEGQNVEAKINLLKKNSWLLLHFFFIFWASDKKGCLSCRQNTNQVCTSLKTSIFLEARSLQKRWRSLYEISLVHWLTNIGLDKKTAQSLFMHKNKNIYWMCNILFILWEEILLL